MDDTIAEPRLGDLSRATSRGDDRPVTTAQAQLHDAAPAICRICRGEGTSAEPLFYPCKCSGSIKYVHQDCLMEWLSHSQKKHCELCKTSFRFTKLYAPDMPQSLPVHVFIQHMGKYLFRNFLVWMRAAVAISVWVFWLPYFMRSVWAFMFWFSDEGLGTSVISRGSPGHTSDMYFASAMSANGTCPASPLLAPNTTSLAAAEAVLEGLKAPSISDFLLRLLLASLGIPLQTEYTSNTSATHESSSGLHPSFLSEVAFLRSITKSPTLHRTLVSVLEGQLITVLVILSFILVILVRDYVVQQQPEINMRAAFAGLDDVPQPDPVRVEPEPAPENAPRNAPLALRGAESDAETLDEGDDTQQGSTTWETIDAAASDTTEAQYSTQDVPDSASNPGQRDINFTAAEATDSSSSFAVEAPSESSDAPSHVSEYLRIYRQADGDPERMQQIADREGIRDRLDYWIGLARRAREDPNPIDDAPGFPSFEDAMMVDNIQARDNAGEGSSSSIPVPREQLHPTSSSTSSSDHATMFDRRDRLPPLDAAGHAFMGPDPARPRAVSDGPRPADTINPLANNSWSFAALENLAPNDENDVTGNEAHPSDTTTGVGSANDGALDVWQDHATGPVDNIDFNSSMQDPVHAPEQLEMLDAENVPATEASDEASALNPEPAGLVDRVADFMWGGLDEHQVADVEEQAQHQEEDAHDDPWLDIPVDDAAEDQVQADVGGEVDAVPGADAEAIEDMDDFEGVAELIGMRGPIAGLFQNAIFCSVLVSVTIFACIFIPYNVGRVTVWIMANPMRLLRMLFELSKLVQDAAILVGGLTSWCALNLVDIVTSFVGGFIGAQVLAARKASWVLWTRAGSRVMSYALMDFPTSAVEVRNFSAISHEALLVVKANIRASLQAVQNGISLLFGGGIIETSTAIGNLSKNLLAHLATLWVFVLSPSSWVIDLGEPENPAPTDPELAYWPGLDRFWAILAGYLTVFVIGAMYLKRGSPFARGNAIQNWEAGVIDSLHQASGIMKVILIISIEMLVFPLYCGLLLDAGLLPLFENATFKSRMLFTYNYPLTSVFVHWFIGTGYMFHFALFVSMCRKIMRPGVLYFIRDPDDPEFHPVRDVLERNLATQLRKILFSAFVYGALVIVCLGGVVWGLSFTIPSVLPIHYSSNEPILEFPVDLLFYNFLLPFVVKVFKPSRGLQIMYTWWFRRCARGLRLTFFLFGERRIDEEGTLRLAEDSPHRNLLPYRRFFLELDDNNRVIPKTWRDTWEGGNDKPIQHTSRRAMKAYRRAKGELVDSGQLVHDGRFVRAPASDRIKIPKGRKVFLPVSERNHRKDGNPETDLYASSQYEMVYIPPHFRARIFVFIMFLWLFAAFTGVGFTIIPLVFGRKIFQELIPADVRTNDVYAFSIGVCLLGSVAYCILHWQMLWAKIKGWVDTARQAAAEQNALRFFKSASFQGLKLAYAYFFLLVVFPLLISVCMELYILMPLHTHINPPTAASIQAARDEGGNSGRHTIRITQAWTLGLLYLNLAYQTIVYLLPGSRLATAARVVMLRGWLRPQVSVLTRAFIVPGLGIAAVAIFGPPMMTSFLIGNGVFSTGQPIVNEAAEAARLAIIYRFAYPAASLLAVFVRNAIGMVKVFQGWTAKIRDEAYLIGERLHNFGAATAGSKRGGGGGSGRAAWRARGARL
ncbi:hypothetical protein S7711_03715 [Stachybotrys chartarum IBT 7711]|uniref:RING-type E3 ubiquitin transferase n=1 Tax=Stachybotrys chartarum (strain CBS 109288 / IBT 7711) TaxID=1280523 RepID=A0A084B7M8_STACB|nr:hypothetical protein S7711_03715 [Stachybotrys chartarum IBT 7711]KFA48244.1 hypothetical protein S40293_07362 [Stachybotrys chartarum IBT 40293]